MHVSVQRLRQILLTVESARFQHIGYTAVQALGHAIGARRSELGQTMLYVQLLACAAPENS
jgi:hypothetical protein